MFQINSYGNIFGVSQIKNRFIQMLMFELLFSLIFIK